MIKIISSGLTDPYGSVFTAIVITIAERKDRVFTAIVITIAVKTGFHGNCPKIIFQ